jgi:hypothetical protein
MVAESEISRRRSDTALAILASLSMLAFAWSGFQSSEWVRERFQRSDDAAAASEQSLELAAEADRLEERDTLLFIEWLVALDSGEPATADIIFDLFRPPVQEFVLTVEFDERGLPVESLLDSTEYDVFELRTEAAELDREAQKQRAGTREASKTGARYGGLGLLFAAVLASTGVATRFESSRVRRPILIASTAVIAIGLIALMLTPLSMSA